MLDLDHLAGDAGCLRCVGDGTENFLGVLLHACFVLSRRILDHLHVGREHMNVSAVTLAPTHFAKAMPCRAAFPESSDPSVGIRMSVYIALTS